MMRTEKNMKRQRRSTGAKIPGAQESDDDDDHFPKPNGMNVRQLQQPNVGRCER